MSYGVIWSNSVQEMQEWGATSAYMIANKHPELSAPASLDNFMSRSIDIDHSMVHASWIWSK